MNMGGEQIYLFDINDPNSSKTFFGSSSKYPGNCCHCFCCVRVVRVKITVVCILINIYLLIGSIERDQKLDEYYAKQNDVDDTGDFADKNVKILPPHVEEVKRLVSLQIIIILYAYVLNKKIYVKKN